MLKLLSLLGFLSLLIACSSHFIATSSSAMPSTQTMFTANGITLKPITLQAREEKNPPVGQPLSTDRNIGFADIFLQLENHREVPAVVLIEKIQIQAVTTGRVYMALTAPQTIHLRPLEYSAQDFHLTNKTGFAGQGAIQAIVTLNIADQSITLTSPALSVDRL